LRVEEGLSQRDNPILRAPETNGSAVRATFSGLQRTWGLEVRYFFQISQWKQRFEEFCLAPKKNKSLPI
jgi:hypothetical protein